MNVEWHRCQTKCYFMGQIGLLFNNKFLSFQNFFHFMVWINIVMKFLLRCCKILSKFYRNYQKWPFSAKFAFSFYRKTNLCSCCSPIFLENTLRSFIKLIGRTSFSNKNHSFVKKIRYDRYFKIIRWKTWTFACNLAIWWLKSITE